MGFGRNSLENILPKTPQIEYIEITKLIAIMVEFQEDENPYTTGNGKYLSYNLEDYPDALERCDGFIVDRPPHNQTYFQSQLDAVNNYFFNVSNENFEFTNLSVLPEIITVSNEMAYYSENDNRLGELFTEVVTLAENELIEFDENSLIVVFHAGIGQDFVSPFLDPTPYDLPSAFLDNEMLSTVEIPIINGVEVNRGILLPETQNHIYFDVIEDLYYGETDFCDYQLGMTGLFAFLLGYALELPPLYNTDTGEAGVGIFGLMDHGSNNGRGVIPAVPTAWTRILKGWTNSIAMMGIINIPARESNNDVIYKYNITDNNTIMPSGEYFLVENRKNWIKQEANYQYDIDTLRYINKISDTQLGHWFDVVISEMSSNQIFFSEDSVILGFDNYDYGLPHSGLLIWHVDEPNIDSLFTGINNDRENRAIHLEEADGAVDIGYDTQVNIGWQYDMWYHENHGFSDANPYEEDTRFDNYTTPNTQSNNGAESFISFTNISEPKEVMTFTANHEGEFEIIELSEFGMAGTGNGVIDDVGMIFERRNITLFSDEIFHVDIFQITDEDEEIIAEDLYSRTIVLTKDNEIYFARDSLMLPMIIDEQVVYEQFPTRYGYLENSNELTSIDNSFSSLGDIDLDGLDEMIYINDNSVYVKNFNGTLVNGFPVDCDFGDFLFQNPLIANVIGDEHPEIIVRGDDKILIISHEGIIEREFASSNTIHPLAIVPNWRITEEDTLMALIDSRRLILFPQDSEHNYWLNSHSRPSNNPIVTGRHFDPSVNQNSSGIKAYNYPNPIMSGETTFRFKTGESNSVTITIYDVAGFKIDELSKSGLTHYEWNEIRWETTLFEPGLYYAEVIADGGSSVIVKVVVIK